MIKPCEMKVTLVKLDEDMSPFLSLEDLDRYVLGSPQSSHMDRMILSPCTPFSSLKRFDFSLTPTPSTSRAIPTSTLSKDNNTNNNNTATSNNNALSVSAEKIDIVDFLKSPLSVSTQIAPQPAESVDQISTTEEMMDCSGDNNNNDPAHLNNNEFFQKIVNSCLNADPEQASCHVVNSMEANEIKVTKKPEPGQQEMEQQEAMKSLISVMAISRSISSSNNNDNSTTTSNFSISVTAPSPQFEDQEQYNEVKRTRSKPNSGIQKSSKVKKFFNLDNKIHNYSAEEFQQTCTTSVIHTTESTSSIPPASTSSQKRTKKRNVKFFNNEFNQFVNGTHKTQQKPSKEKFKFTKMYW